MSDQEFKPGDIAIAQFFEHHPEYNGEECLVLGGLEVRSTGFLDTCETRPSRRYRIEMPGGQVLNCLAHQLRRRADPKPQETEIKTLELTE